MILFKCDATVDSAVDFVMNQWWSIAHGSSGVSHPIGPSAAVQYEWEKPPIAADLARVTSSLPDSHHQARQLAVSAAHIGVVHALPIIVDLKMRFSSCGLRLDDETIVELLWVCVLEQNFVNLIS